MTKEFRTEKDSMGRVPGSNWRKLRCINCKSCWNFPISNL